MRGQRVRHDGRSYLVDATRSSHAIDGLALERSSYRAVYGGSADAAKGVKAVTLDAVPAESLATFAGERADLPLTLAHEPARRISSAEGLGRVYRELEEPLIPVLADIERAGVRVDTGHSAAPRRRDAGRARRALRDDLRAGRRASSTSTRRSSSPTCCSSKLNLQAGKKTGKTRVVSTAQDVLEELAQTHELPGLVLKWRSIQKLKGTYVDALPSLVNPATGRVHTTFNQAVAATGRLSSSDPNLQNIPIRTPLGREIRAAFVAAPGHVLISADYSQIELRVLAHLSGDAALVDAFTQGIDIHDRTAERVFGTNSGLDPHELRRRAKIINYALLYGKTAFTLAKDIGVSQQAAQEFIDAYFAGFPGVRAFIDQTLADARVTGVVRTITGRRRLVPELTSKNGMIRVAAERETVNMPIQGTAADVLKQAMIDVHAALAAHNAGRPAPARMILTVHDELLFEAPDGDAEEVAALVRAVMEQRVSAQRAADRRRRHRPELEGRKAVNPDFPFQTFNNRCPRLRRLIALYDQENLPHPGFACHRTALRAAAQQQEVKVVIVTEGGPMPMGISGGPMTPMASGTGVVFGQVTEADSNRPVAGALVTLNVSGSTPIRVMADAQGRFGFRDLPAGRFNLSTMRPGWVDGAYGRTRPAGPALSLSLTAGEKVSGVTVPMWRYAVIAGRVVDESGEPIVSKSVRVLKRTTVGGKVRLGDELDRFDGRPRHVPHRPARTR